MCGVINERCAILSCFFFFNDTATTEIYTLSLHDALPIFTGPTARGCLRKEGTLPPRRPLPHGGSVRSEEHTSELQSPCNLVCRLLLEKKQIRHAPARECRPVPPADAESIVRSDRALVAGD